MTATQGWRRWRTFVLFGLVLMVLVRLVWMQLRHYPLALDIRGRAAYDIVSSRFDGECRKSRQVLRGYPDAAERASKDQHKITADDGLESWFATPGGVLIGVLSCRSELAPEVFYIKWNQWLLIGTVFCAAFLARFTTGSWTAAAVGATVLLSRGRFLTDLGLVSTKSALQFFVTLWLATGAHFFRSGSSVMAFAMAVAVTLASFFDGVCLALAGAMPIFLLLSFTLRKRLARPMIRRFRVQPGDLVEIPDEGREHATNDSLLRRMGETMRWFLGTDGPSFVRLRTQRPDYRQGGLFSTLKVPFLLWASYRRRWLRIFAWGWVTLGLGCAVLITLKTLLVGSDWKTVPSMPMANLLEASKVLISGGWGRHWFAAALSGWDTHFTLSLGVIVICACISPAKGLPSYWDTACLFLIGILLLAVASLFGDFVDGVFVAVAPVGGRGLPHGASLGRLPPREFLSWMEPAVLSLAVAGIYNLIEVLDSRSLISTHRRHDGRSPR